MVVVLLLAAGAAFLAWAVVRTAAANEFARKYPLLVQRVAPAHPKVVFSLARLEFATSRGQLSSQTLDRLKEASRAAPVAEEPLLYIGMAAAFQDRARASELFKEVARREPRSRLARLFLLDDHLRAARVPEATIEIAALMRLIPQTNKVLLPELAKFARDPRTAGALQRTLEADPELKQALLSHLASTGKDVDLVFRLAGAEAGSGRKPAGWQLALLKKLAADGDVRRAHALWQRLDPTASGTLIYDPGFTGRAAPAPFGWVFSSGSGGVAEPASGGKLEIQYYGRENADLAKQLLVLDPGSYQLSMRVAGKSNDNTSGISWSVVCHDNERELGVLKVRELSFTEKPLSLSFVVPSSGCRAQSLILAGLSKEFPATESLTISALQLTKGKNR